MIYIIVVLGRHYINRFVPTTKQNIYIYNKINRKKLVLYILHRFEVEKRYFGLVMVIY